MAAVYGVLPDVPLRNITTMEQTFDTNTPNGTTQGPPASFEER